MNRHVRWSAGIVFVAAGLAAASSIGAEAGAATGKLSGKVQDATTRVPLSGAKITVGTTGLVATSGADGAYAVDKVPAGKHKVTCALGGYKPDARTVVIPAGDEIKLVFVLKAIGKEPQPLAKAEPEKDMKSVAMAEEVSAPAPSMAAGGASAPVRRASREKRAAPSAPPSLAPAPPPAPAPRAVRVDAADAADAPGHSGEEYQSLQENPFLAAAVAPVSTFSIDVDTASYANTRRFLTGNSLPPKDAVRIEELVNYFPYDYTPPQGAEPFSINTEISTCPWAKGHRLVLIGLQGKKVDTGQLPPANLVFLIDSSGSMSAQNKLPLLIQAFKLLVGQMRKVDKVAITVYAGSAGVVLPPTSGDEKGAILAALDSLAAGGSTAGGAGIQLAYSVAKEGLVQGGNNRVILATDGDFNVGASSDAELERLIEEKRNQGVFLTVLGFGEGNYKDSKMKKLADKGNGNYAYIDTVAEAQKVLVNQMGGTLFTIAKDVKIQIELNPARVKAYRLIGYESRILAKEDFDNDKKDAGELGAGHTVTAFYEIIPAGSAEPIPGLKAQEQAAKPSAEAAASKDLLTVKLRYKKPTGSESKLLTHGLADQEVAFDTTSETFRFASAVVELGLLLRDSPWKGSAAFASLTSRAKGAIGRDQFGYRKEFVTLAEKAAALQAH
ncbi:MAG: von Willebrand factor type A domain-containing protein [Deltaproteobacteria bacterium]|nr:von Willebrand factor type A domain-containing protein [Deltaproteobacteria bacterium]